MTGEIDNLVGVLRQAHHDNGLFDYFAVSKTGDKFSHEIMPVTPFVFELFIYNSIYEIDWTQSLAEGAIVNHSRKLRENEKQKALEEFLKSPCIENASFVYDSFASLSHCEITGDWTAVQPDIRISESDGIRFFNLLSKIQTLVKNQQPVDETFFAWLEQSRRYIYLVRNNIFHGAKRLGQTYEPGQKKRIETYLMLLRGITSLFFKVMSARLGFSR